MQRSSLGIEWSRNVFVFDHIVAKKNIRDALSQLSESIVGKNQWNCTGAFDACPEIPSDLK